MQYAQHFIPLESDPQIFTKLMHDLGVSTNLQFIDVPSLDTDMLDAISNPVLALILVLPECPAYNPDEAQYINTDEVIDEPVWLKQTINNACGLYAILHSVCNIPGAVDPGTPLDDFLKSHDRIAYLEGSEEIRQLYAKSAMAGSSEVPAAEDDVDHHYVCLVERSSGLYLLDGDMEGPLYKGKLGENESILSKRCLDIIREYTDSRKDGAFALLGLVDSTL